MSGLKTKFKTAVSIPVLRRGDAVVSLHGEILADPYRSLEDLVASSTVAWMDAQEDQYGEYIAGKPDAETMKRLAEAYQAPHKGIPHRMGGNYIFYYKGANDKQSKIMISDTPEGQGRVLVDAEKIDPSGKTEIGGGYASPDGRYLAYRVLESGKWEAGVRIKDMTTLQDLPDITSKAGTIWWDKDGKGYSYNQLAAGDKSRGVTKHHKLGDAEENDTVVYDDKNTPRSYGSLSNGAFRNHAAYAGKHDWLFWTNDPGLEHGVALKDPQTGKYRELFPPGAVNVVPVADTPNGVLFWTTAGAPNGRVVEINPEKPEQENWKTVIPENPDDALQHVFMHKGRLMGLYNHNCAEALRVFGMDGKQTGEVPLPEPSRLYFGHASIPGTSLAVGVQPQDGEDLYFEAATFRGPPKVFRYDAEENALAPLETKPAGPDLSDCIVEQKWATSKDGTKIPMTVIRRKDVELDGTAAVRLFGYGGFGFPQGPDFNAEMMDHVRSGGIYVQANVRGGGEFGQPWHDGGRARNKGNSFDDLNACAEFLIDSNYTSAGRIVSEGHSNGGLLVLGAMQRRPDLYGAVISSSPVADMTSEKHPVTATEYGDPFKDKDDFEAIKKTAPLLNVKDGEKLPPVLVHTGLKDDMLIRGALKLVATMRHANPDNTILLHVEKDYGHALARPADVAINEIMARKAFIERSIGPISQKDYAAQLAAQPKTPQYTS